MIALPDPNVLECIECTPLLREFVVRAYVTGSRERKGQLRGNAGYVVRVPESHRL